MNPSTRAIVILALSYCVVGSCEVPDDTVAPQPGVQFELPASTDVNVEITSESCDHLQMTVIHWPNGTADAFTTDSPASPDSHASGYDPESPTIITYGTATYHTGSGTQQASVEVFDKLPSDPTWSPTLWRIEGNQVQAEGHRNVERYDWNDTIVTFTW